MHKLGLVDLLSVIISKILSIGLSFWILSRIAFTWGVEGIGIYDLITSTILLASIMSTPGINFYSQMKILNFLRSSLFILPSIKRENITADQFY